MASVRWRDVAVPSFIAERTAGNTQLSELCPVTRVHRSPSELRLSQDLRPSTLREQQRQALQALERLEEERDVAADVARSWEERIARAEAERSELQCQLEVAQQRQDAELHHEAEETLTSSTQLQEVSDNQDRVDSMAEECTALENRLQRLTHDHEVLQNSCEERKAAKENAEQDLTSIMKEVIAWEEAFENGKSEAQLLEEHMKRVQSHALKQTAVVEQELLQRRQQSMERLQCVQRNEVREQQLSQIAHDLKKLLAELRDQKEEIGRHLEDQAEASGTGNMRHADVCRRRQLEATIEHLKQSLDTAHSRNARLQECMISNARAFSLSGTDEDRQLQALTDQLCQSQEKLKHCALAQVRKQSKLGELEAQYHALQEQVESATSERLAAQSGAKSALIAHAPVKEKNVALESSFSVISAQREEAEKLLQTLHKKDVTLQAENEYFASRVEGNRLDICAMKRELAKCESKITQETKVTSHLKELRLKTDRQLQICEAEVVSLRAEIRQLQEEDMLDEYGRVKCILIDSEHEIIDRLGINEFLTSAQKARRPVPLLIEKISEILERIHRANMEAEKFSEYVDDSRRRIAAWRRKNAQVRKTVKSCDAWKTGLLQKIVSNTFDAGRKAIEEHNSESRGLTILLSGLELRTEHLGELLQALQRHSGQEAVFEVQLQDNKLDESSLSAIVELLESCPRLCRIDLRRNLLDQHSVEKLQRFSSQASEATVDDHPELVIDVTEQQPSSMQSDSASLTSGSDGDSEIQEDVSDTALFLSSIGLGTQNRILGASASKLPALSPSSGTHVECGKQNVTRSPSLASESTRSQLSSHMWSSSLSFSELCSPERSRFSIPSSSSGSWPTQPIGRCHSDSPPSPNCSRPQTPGSSQSSSRLRGLSGSAASLLAAPSQTTLLPASPQRVSPSSSTIPPLSPSEFQESPIASPTYWHLGKTSKAREKREKAIAKAFGQDLGRSMSEVVLPRIITGHGFSPHQTSEDAIEL